MDKVTKNDDLTDLLNEAKSTILDLQAEIDTLKTEIEILRHKNQEYAKQIGSLDHGINTKLKNFTIEQHTYTLYFIRDATTNST